MDNSKKYILCKVSTNALIIYQDKIVLAQLNKPEHKRGLWSLPGGKVDEGETFEIGLEREIFEETGITSDQYTYQKVAILHEAPDSTCKHVYVVHLNQEINQFNFDPKEIIQVSAFELKKEVLEKIKFRNTWVLPLILDYMEGRLGT